MLGEGTISFIQRAMPGSLRSLVPQSVRVRVAGLLSKIDDRDQTVVAAKAATEAGDWEAAAALWQEVLKRSHGFGADTAAAKLSEAFRILGRLDEAEAALPGESANPVVAIEAARIAMARGDWPEARKRWRFCLESVEKNQHLCIELSRTYRVLKEFAEAEELISDALSKWPDERDLIGEYARIAHDQKEWPEAASRWRKFLDCYENNVPSEGRFGLSIALKSLGDDEGASAVFLKYQSEDFDAAYGRWIAEFDSLSNEDRSMIVRHIDDLSLRPKFSILMPVYNTSHDVLRAALDSVLGQFYPDWELCIADDASPDPEIRAILEEFRARDSRVRPIYRNENGGIAASTNTALAEASGDWVALMDHDDVLAPHALYMVAERLNRCPDATIVYSDEDHIDQFGTRSNPYFKPNFNYDLLLGQNLFNHLTVYRADLAKSVGGFREGFDGSQDWDFALRALDAAPEGSVEHIPFVLYHWRQTGQNFSAKSLSRAVATAERAVNEHLARRGLEAVAVPTGHSSHLRVKWPLPTPRPLVSIVIPTKDRAGLLRTCVDGLLRRTDYAPMEIVIVDNGTTEQDAVQLLETLRQSPNITILNVPEPFNFSRLINLGVANSRGEVVLLLNNDVDVIHPDWLEELVSHATRPDVGAVGAKLYFDNDTVQHGGVVLGLNGVAGHAFTLSPRDCGGYVNRLQLTHELSCVTAACLAIRREVFDKVGGFDEEHLAVSFNDVDFCIRVREAGYRIIWTPGAELYHYESISRDATRRPNRLSGPGRK